MTARHVRPIRAVTKPQVSGALAASWGRAAFRHGKGAMADRIEITPRCINRALTGETVPELHSAVNSLLVDPTALDEVFALIGFRVAPLASDTADAADALGLATGLSGALADCLNRIDDGNWCASDRAALVKQFRPLVQKILAMIDADDARAGLRPDLRVARS